MRNTLANLIKKAIKSLQKEKVFPKFEIPEIKIEHPKEEIHGDYSTNVAMEIAKKVKKRPMEIANLLSSKLIPLSAGQSSKLFEKIEVAEPGFINFFLSKEYLQNQLKEILKRGKDFSKLNIGKNKKVNVEFISANPTGPLTLGNGRGGFCGDVLANVLSRAGYKVSREYYINDVGEQIRKLGHSVIGDSEAVYKGDYIEDLKKRVKGKNPDEVGQKAAKIILEELIKPTVKRMGIKFDKWFSEKSLYQSGEVDKILNWLKKKKLAYEKEGALWFLATKFGDDKDRVLVRQNGEKTYFASDIAYLKNKFKRGFDILIFFWGADHAGYVKRMEGAVQALGYKKAQAKFIIFQLVRLFEKGKEVRISKRTGTFVTLDELIDEVGLDVARFFFLMRSSGSHLNFDLDLAKEQSEKNPVYYVQYAHARICSILRKLKTQISKVKTTSQNLKLLNHPAELNLIKQLIRFPEIVEDTVRDYQVQRLPNYALELARKFHDFYENCRVISEDKDLTKSRLALILACKIVLKNTLDLMGISAPESM
jgi:arginyl-tRNA synthetase